MAVPCTEQNKYWSNRTDQGLKLVETTPLVTMHPHTQLWLPLTHQLPLADHSLITILHDHLLTTQCTIFTTNALTSGWSQLTITSSPIWQSPITDHYRLTICITNEHLLTDHWPSCHWRPIMYIRTSWPDMYNYILTTVNHPQNMHSISDHSTISTTIGSTIVHHPCTDQNWPQNDHSHVIKYWPCILWHTCVLFSVMDVILYMRRLMCMPMKKSMWNVWPCLHINTCF